MSKIYLETSFISACVTTRSTIRSVYEREVSLYWWKQEAPKHNVFVSDEVVHELSDPRYPRSAEAMKFIEGIEAISVVPKMVTLAKAFVDRQVMPKPIGGDALHVAMATVAAMEYVVTWNVKHLANPNKVLHLNAVCFEFGLMPPKILRPDDMTDLEEIER